MNRKLQKKVNKIVINNLSSDCLRSEFSRQFVFHYSIVDQQKS